MNPTSNLVQLYQTLYQFSTSFNRMPSKLMIPPWPLALLTIIAMGLALNTLQHHALMRLGDPTSLHISRKNCFSLTYNLLSSSLVSSIFMRVVQD